MSKPRSGWPRVAGMARSERSCLRISPNLRPSAVSLRASVRLLTPDSRATESSRAFPCGKSGVIAFSTVIRSEPALERRCASACSQWWSRISLRYGSAQTRGSCAAFLSKTISSVSAPNSILHPKNFSSSEDPPERPPRRLAPGRTGLAYRHMQRSSRTARWAGGLHMKGCRRQCPLCGGGRRWRLRWPRGRRPRWPWRHHGVTHSGLWAPVGGVRAGHPTSPGVLRYRSDLHDAAEYGALGAHVKSPECAPRRAQHQEESEGSQTSGVARFSLASGRAAAGNCSTVARWPTHSHVSSTTWPSGNSSAS